MDGVVTWGSCMKGTHKQAMLPTIASVSEVRSVMGIVSCGVVGTQQAQPSSVRES